MVMVGTVEHTGENFPQAVRAFPDHTQLLNDIFKPDAYQAALTGGI